MPQQVSAAVYHIDTFQRVPPGRLMHVEDRPGGQADIYFHPLHAREPLVWQLNWVLRAQVGLGHWRQRWADGDRYDRMQQAPEGRGICMARWEIVSPDRMPKGRHVFPVEQAGSVAWLIRGGSCTAALCDEHNEMMRRIAGDGLWVQAWNGDQEPRAEGQRPSLIEPSAHSILV